MDTIILDGVEYELHPKNETPYVKLDHASGHKPTCASLNRLLLSHPPQPAPCDCGYEKPATEEVLDLLMNIRKGINEIDTRLWVLSGWWR